MRKAGTPLQVPQYPTSQDAVVCPSARSKGVRLQMPVPAACREGCGVACDVLLCDVGSVFVTVPGLVVVS